MNSAAEMTPDLDVPRLRAAAYNATVTRIVVVHPELWRITVRTDSEPISYRAGQYVTLGLGGWEPRAPGCQLETLSPAEQQKLIRRAYSIGARLLDFGGDGAIGPATGAIEELCLQSDGRELEFYIVLVRTSETRPPALTPRIFLLQEGDRIYVSPHAHGRCTLEHVGPRDNLILASTGTGEAPHNAMLAEMLSRNHAGRIILVSSVRYRRDLGYLREHDALMRRFPHYQFIALVTREAEQYAASDPCIIRQRRLQAYFTKGEFTRDTGLVLSPLDTHVFLCGSPQMIGVPHRAKDGSRQYPEPQGMVEILERIGFVVDTSHEQGNLHFETYW